jgi:3D (Asp-Asp-Asp) domain-containing protein
MRKLFAVVSLVTSLLYTPVTAVYTETKFVEVKDMKAEKALNELQQYTSALEKELALRDKIDSAEVFRITSYDLSYASCEKWPTSRGYGKTRNGTDLRGHSWQTARAIAVDPTVIPLGKRVLIKFVDIKYKEFDGIYTAALKANILTYLLEILVVLKQVRKQ